MTNEQTAVANTDREIYRVTPGDFYSDSVHVTEDGGLGIDVGGHVIVKPLKEWHELGKIQNNIIAQAIAQCFPGRPSRPKIFIAAANAQHAQVCARERGMAPSEWVYASDARQLRGMRGSKIIWYETWLQHPEAIQIKELARAYDFVDVT